MKVLVIIREISFIDLFLYGLVVFIYKDDLNYWFCVLFIRNFLDNYLVFYNFLIIIFLYLWVFVDSFCFLKYIVIYKDLYIFL